MPKRASNARKNSEASDNLGSPIGHNSGYESSRHNATRHGVFSERDVLEWEDEDEFKELHESLIEEFEPAGRTEFERVKDLARIEWRRKRLRIAEQAAINDGLRVAVDDGQRTASAAFAHLGLQFKDEKINMDTILITPAEITKEKKAQTDDAMRSVLLAVNQLERILDAGLGDDEVEVNSCVQLLVPDLGQEILSALEEGEIDVEEHDSRATAVLEFIRSEFFPRLERAYTDYIAYTNIPYQAIGSALFTEELQKLMRYEAHLDRKYERTLAILLRLREIRETRERNKLGRRSE